MTRRAWARAATAVALGLSLRGSPPASGDAVRLVLAVGTPRAAAVVAEVVHTPESRNRGLGGREHLAADAGMVFVYPTAEPRTFWMKDCLLGLDIAFIGEDARILNVATLGPGRGLPDAAIPRAHSAGAAPFVLEVNAGWLAAHGVAAGDRVEGLGPLVGLAKR